MRRAPAITVTGAPSSVTRELRPGGVEARRCFDRDAVADLDDGHVVADRDEQHRRGRSAEHHAGVAGCRPGRHRHARPVERDGADGRPVGESREEAGLQLGVRGCGEHGAGDHRRHERAGRIGASEFLDHHHQLFDAVPGPADVLGQVQAEPAEFGELAPDSAATQSDGDSSSARAAPRRSRLSAKLLTVSASERWSSVMAMDMVVEPRVTGDGTPSSSPNAITDDDSSRQEPGER